MSSICNPLITPDLKTQSHLRLLQSPFLITQKLQLKTKLTLKSNSVEHTIRFRPCSIMSSSDSSASTSEIEMVRTKQGIYAPGRSKVVVLWDLDNKPPRGPPYQAAMSLKKLAQRFGDVVEMSAYANRHAFHHLPEWILEERRERKQLDVLERKGMITPNESYVCGVCGRKYKTNLDLKKHFKQLHERERQKKVGRMRSLKGKKRQKYNEKYLSGNHKYIETEKVLMKPKTGYGLASELKRAGVFVKTVEDKPQAADYALKRQMQHSMSRGIDLLFLISDDSDFSEMLGKAREANLETVVVGDRNGVLGRHADLWMPWAGVENGDDLVPETRPQDLERNNGLVSFTCFDDEFDLNIGMDEVVVGRTRFGGVRISSVSDDEEDWVIEEDEEYISDDYLLEYDRFG